MSSVDPRWAPPHESQPFITAPPPLPPPPPMLQRPHRVAYVLAVIMPVILLAVMAAPLGVGLDGRPAATSPGSATTPRLAGSQRHRREAGPWRSLLPAGRQQRLRRNQVPDHDQLGSREPDPDGYDDHQRPGHPAAQFVLFRPRPAHQQSQHQWCACGGHRSEASPTFTSSPRSRSPPAAPSRSMSATRASLGITSKATCSHGWPTTGVDHRGGTRELRLVVSRPMTTRRIPP